MNYPLRTKQKQPNRYKFIVVTVVFAVFGLLSLFAPNAMKTVFYTLGRPLSIGANYTEAWFGGIGSFFESKNALLAENRQLQLKIDSLSLKEADYDVLFRENQELKTMVGRDTRTTRIIGYILSKPPRSPFDTLVIDIGSEEGVVVGDSVYLAGNTIVGLVSSVTKSTALVTLFSSSDQTQDAMLERTGATFTLKGLGGQNLSVEVPKDTDILWGDVFVYQGLSRPTIGSVYFIDVNPQSSFKTIFVKMPGNILQSKEVFVEKDVI